MSPHRHADLGNLQCPPPPQVYSLRPCSLHSPSLIPPPSHPASCAPAIVVRCRHAATRPTTWRAPHPHCCATTSPVAPPRKPRTHDDDSPTPTRIPDSPPCSRYSAQRSPSPPPTAHCDAQRGALPAAFSLITTTLPNSGRSAVPAPHSSPRTTPRQGPARTFSPTAHISTSPFPLPPSPRRRATRGSGPAHG